MLADWVPFFSACATASAALVGLLIVAMSVNVDAIVAIPSMPSRAGSTIANVMVVVIASVVALIPTIDPSQLGASVIVVGVVALALSVDALARLLRSRQGRGFATGSAVTRGLVGVIPALVVVGGGAVMFADAGAGLIVVAIGFVLVFIESVVNAWVLLIEIRR